MGRQQLTCRLRRIAPTVQLIEYANPESKRLSVQGVHTCKSPLCSLCAPKWQRTRSDEVTKAIEHWGPDRAFFATLTMRHHRRMRLALQHRLLTAAYGNLWSGRQGQLAAKLIGGKPESIRAHDRTWSDAHGWHPHLHALLFVRPSGLSDVMVREALESRWSDSLGTALRRMRRLATLVLTAPGERARLEASFHARTRGVARPRFAAVVSRKLAKLSDEHLADRARKVFGAKLVPQRASVHDCMRELLRDLEHFTEKNIAPSAERGVRAERVRAADRAADYLAKLGLELATPTTKLGKVGGDGLTHYSLWEVGQLCAKHGHPLRVPARRAWSELFRASFGTQTITFSNRDRLGLGPDPYADGGEPEEKQPDEWVRFVGAIPLEVWDPMARSQKHGLLVSLIVAHQKGLLDDLPYVETPGGHPNRIQHRPRELARPPPPMDPTELATALAAAETRGGAVVRAAWDALNQPAAKHDSLWIEELRHRIRLAIGIEKESSHERETESPAACGIEPG